MNKPTPTLRFDTPIAHKCCTVPQSTRANGFVGFAICAACVRVCLCLCLCLCLSAVCLHLRVRACRYSKTYASTFTVSPAWSSSIPARGPDHRILCFALAAARPPDEALLLAAASTLPAPVPASQATRSLLIVACPSLSCRSMVDYKSFLEQRSAMVPGIPICEYLSTPSL
jgi:hypothetical protein